MADAGAIKAGDAYVEMTLDKSKFDKGMGDAGKDANKGAEKAADPIDKRTEQLTKSLYRMTGAIALIHVAGAAVGGAFATMKAQKQFDFASKSDDLAGMVAAYRKVQDAQTGWLRSIPLIGGMLGSVIDYFKDPALEQFIDRLARAKAEGIGFAQALSTLRQSQMELMKVSGATPQEMTAQQRANAQADLEEQIGKQNKAVNDAKSLMDSAHAAVVKAEEDKNPKPKKGFWANMFAPSQGSVAPVTQEELSAKQQADIDATQNYQNKKKGLDALVNARQTMIKTDVKVKELEAGPITGMQQGAALAGSGASGVAWGAGQVETQSPQEQLVGIQTAQSGKFDVMTEHLAAIAINTAKPLPDSGKVT